MTQTINYSAVLAKIGAERNKLLSEPKLKSLTETKSLQEFTTQLRETNYQKQINKIQLPLTSRKLERAFRKNLIEAIIKLIKNSPKKAEKYLCLYLLRFEVENIKAIVKGTNANLNSQQKLAKTYLTAEDYFKNRVVIEEASKAQSLVQVVDSMKKTDYALALSMGLQSYEEDGSTACIDVLLDNVFYEKLYEAYQSLPKQEKPYAQFYASMNNDGFTLLTLLRGRVLNYDPNWLRLAVPRNNFNLIQETVEALITAVDFDSALKIALETYYARYVVRLASPEETIANSEKTFKNAVLQHAKSSRITENFDIGAPLAFITQREAEVHNLVAIGLGVEAAMKPAEIQSQLSF